MPQSISYLFKRSWEFVPAEEVQKLPSLVRGLYVLYREGEGEERNVVYVGMARGEKSGVKGRLKTHSNSKASLWTHCSVFEVWDNITREQVEELEGLFRHIYRRDVDANSLNVQKAYRPLVKLAKQTAAKISKNAPD